MNHLVCPDDGTRLTVRAGKTTLVCLLAATFVLAGCGPSGQPSEHGAYRFTSASQPGQLVPVARRRPVESFDGRLLSNGRSLVIGKAAGTVQVINWWASWCPPCRAETPQFDLVSRDLRARGVHFVGVDIKDDRSTARAFVRDNGISYPIVYDELGESVQRLGNIPAAGPPFTMVVDRHGRVAAVYLGDQSAKDIRRAIDAVLAET